MNKQETPTIISDMPLKEVRSLVDLNKLPAVIVDSLRRAVGIITEAEYWRGTTLYGGNSPVGMSMNSNCRRLSTMAEVESIHLSETAYYIYSEQDVFYVFSSCDIEILRKEKQVESLANLNNLLKEEVNRMEEKAKGLEQILHSSHDEIFVTDGKGHVLFVSEACKKMTGLPKERFIGKSIYDLEKKGLINNSVTIEVLKKRKTVSAQQNYPGGAKIVATGTPIFGSEGCIIKVITNSRDITELVELKYKLAEAQSLLGQAKSKQKKLKNGILFTESHKMLELIDMAEKIAPTDSTVLIQGESGVGKGLIAKLIHETSLRKDKEFIHVNCGAIPASLIEAELFGYEAGSFTGAHSKGKTGLVEAADGGTLFLDEIGELPMDLQVKLLQLVQDKVFKRVGSHHLKRVNTRIISATNRNLKELVGKNLFREDLYYRLHVVPLNIPPLRSRREDILVLAEKFLVHFNKKYNHRLLLSDGVIASFQSYDWPGNVRELENMIEQLVVTSNEEMVFVSQLPAQMKNEDDTSHLAIQGIMPLKEAVERIERQLLCTAREKYRTSRKMATALEVNQTTIIRKLHKYGLNNEEVISKDA
ncbi:sigma-54 interaction domain-containing protein [Pseudalkalibacillus decolorationis]|uniref:sigma-54 interaction domain-containing protein n=1 Tax=Pseudalkalibacillus decolorationis TaxID=163879 RepID=UPI0021483D83|nr:sigma 54-interacting transcriptional regulator [Pseudalkalibacillus decolorationis]